MGPDTIFFQEGEEPCRYLCVKAPLLGEHIFLSTVKCGDIVPELYQQFPSYRCGRGTLLSGVDQVTLFHVPTRSHPICCSSLLIRGSKRGWYHALSINCGYMQRRSFRFESPAISFRPSSSGHGCSGLT